MGFIRSLLFFSFVPLAHQVPFSLVHVFTLPSGSDGFLVIVLVIVFSPRCGGLVPALFFSSSSFPFPPSLGLCSGVRVASFFFAPVGRVHFAADFSLCYLGGSFSSFLNILPPLGPLLVRVRFAVFLVLNCCVR